jgi:hypothetical protein
VRSSVESISEALDVRQRVRETPWLMVGGATAAGFVTGLVIFRRPRISPANVPAYTPMAAAAFTPPQERPRRSGWLNDLFDLAGHEIKKIAEQAVATASASLKETVAAGIPLLVECTVPSLLSRQRRDEAETGFVHHGNGRPPYSDVHG